MSDVLEPGLGELLRHMLELTDGSAGDWYKKRGLNYRPRYTPIMRVLMDAPALVSDIQAKLSITQGAVSQTVKLMLDDGLIEKQKVRDARQSLVSLSPAGRALLNELKTHWNATFKAIDDLEAEIGLPLRSALKRSIKALEQEPFAARIETAVSPVDAGEQAEIKEGYFTQGGDQYARYRPSYPPKLAAALADLVMERSLALDVGCGTGQFTASLSPYFDRVIGTDTSKTQIGHAERRDNVDYRLEGAEKISLTENSVDLITVAQAAHWFDLDRFYGEVQRIAAPNAIIALISYGVPYIADPINAVFQKGYWQDVHRFWPKERSYVENGYSDIYFPFPEVAGPKLDCRLEMGVEHFMGYIKTWSAYSIARQIGELEEFELLFDALVKHWGQDRKEVIWPISTRLGHIN